MAINNGKNQGKEPAGKWCKALNNNFWCEPPNSPVQYPFNYPIPFL